MLKSNSVFSQMPQYPVSSPNGPWLTGVCRDVANNCYYLTGNNMNLGTSDNMNANLSGVWKLASNFAITGLGMNASTSGMGKIWSSSSGDVWIESTMMVNKLTKDYCSISYNGKTLTYLFENEAVQVSTVFDGTNRYAQFTRLRSIKN